MKQQQQKQKQDHKNQHQQQQQQQKQKQDHQNQQQQQKQTQKQQQHKLKSSLRCCISCILPCGAFDVIRIVHSNGHVQELACTVRAADVMESHPKHILKQPSFDQGPTVIVVPPEAHLQRGKIYFLIPAPNPPPQQSSHKKTATSSSTSTTKRRQQRRSTTGELSGGGGNKAASRRANVVMSSDQYLSEIMSENKDMGGSRERRRGRVGVWRPHLECITETP